VGPAGRDARTPTFRRPQKIPSATAAVRRQATAGVLPVAVAEWLARPTAV